MSFTNKFKNLIGLESDDDYDYEGEVGDVELEQEAEREVHENVIPISKRRQKNNEGSAKSPEQGGFKLLARECLNAEQTEEILQAIKDREVVLVNLQRCKKEDIQRVLDFMGGTAFAVDSKRQEVGVLLYLVTPVGIDPRIIMEPIDGVGQGERVTQVQEAQNRQHNRYADTTNNGYPI